MRYALGFLRFWRDFILGDDWRIAAGVVVVLGVGGLLVGATSTSHTLVALIVTGGIFTVAGMSLVLGR